jgi:hypothetical protein
VASRFFELDGLKTLVEHIDMHLFIFFIDLFNWPMILYKVSFIYFVWRMAFQLNCGKLILMDHQSCIFEFKTLFCII